MGMISPGAILDYVLQDDRTTAVDQFRNANDAHREIRNWNTILARRLRQPAMTVAPRPALSIGDDAGTMYVFGVDPVRRNRAGDVVGSWLLPIPRLCTEMRLYMRARALNADAPITFYPSVVGNPSAFPGVDDASYRASLSNESVVEIDIPLKVEPIARTAFGQGEFALSFFSDTQPGGPVHSLAIFDVGPDWIRVIAGTPGMPELPVELVTGAMMFPSSATPERRYRFESFHIEESAPNFKVRIFSQHPWVIPPVIGDNVDTWFVGGARIEAISIYPVRATSLSPPFTL